MARQIDRGPGRSGGRHPLGLHTVRPRGPSANRDAGRCVAPVRKPQLHLGVDQLRPEVALAVQHCGCPSAQHRARARPQPGCTDLLASCEFDGLAGVDLGVDPPESCANVLPGDDPGGECRLHEKRFAAVHGLDERGLSPRPACLVGATGRHSRGCWSSDSGLLVVISASWRSPNPADRGIDATVDRVDDHPQAAPRLAGGMRRAACGVRHAGRGVRRAACATRGAGRGMHHATCGTRHVARANRRSTAFRANPLHFVHPDRVLGHRLSHDAFRNAVDPGASGRISEMHATPPPEAVAGWP